MIKLFFLSFLVLFQKQNANDGQSEIIQIIYMNIYFYFRYRHTRINSKKMRKRVVQKNGECNVTQTNVAKRRRRYLQDIFTTLVDIKVCI